MGEGSSGFLKEKTGWKPIPLFTISFHTLGHSRWGRLGQRGEFMECSRQRGEKLSQSRRR